MHPHLPAYAMNGRVIKLTGQLGVGLIEVMIALFILAFGALSIANMQASALSAAWISSSHFALDSLATEIVEHLKADSTEAGLGSYNTSFSELSADAALPAQRAAIINGWKSRVATSLRSGAGEINCSAINCAISLRWNEKIGSGATQQFYNLSFPIAGN